MIEYLIIYNKKNWDINKTQLINYLSTIIFNYLINGIKN